jgi:hypothetical protein
LCGVLQQLAGVLRSANRRCFSPLRHLQPPGRSQPCGRRGSVLRVSLVQLVRLATNGSYSLNSSNQSNLYPLRLLRHRDRFQLLDQVGNNVETTLPERRAVNIDPGIGENARR